MEIVTEPPTSHLTNLNVTIAPSILTFDKFLSVNLLVALLLGVPANLTALYFFTRVTRGRDLPTQLYRRICVVDLLTCLSHLPVMVCLLRSREPGWFAQLWFCTAWRILFRSLQLLAVFLVMLLSVSRAVVICFPFRAPSKRTVVWLFRGYLVFLTLQYAVLRTRQVSRYDKRDGYCYEDYGDIEIFGVIDDKLYELEIGVPSILITISFIISIIKLKRANIVQTSGQCSKKEASVTIILVTAIFLTCNLPQFVNMALWNLDYDHFKNYSTHFYRNYFIQFYTWNISAVQMVVLNSYLSPIVYFTRIKDFKKWVLAGGDLVIRKYSHGGSFSERNNNSVAPIFSRKECTSAVILSNDVQIPKSVSIC